MRLVAGRISHDPNYLPHNILASIDDTTSLLSVTQVGLTSVTGCFHDEHRARLYSQFM